MIRTNPQHYEEDLALKRFVLTPDDQKPRYDWGTTLSVDGFEPPAVKVNTRFGERDFELSEVAETIGAALTNLLLSRSEQDIFNEKNRSFVSQIARAVAEKLSRQARNGEPLAISENDVNHLIEKALIDHDAYDVARSLVVHRSAHSRTDGVSLMPRIIRRNGQVVPWNTDKVEIAVRKAFLSQQLDSAPAQEVANAVAERVNDLGLGFVNIEDVQDVVQEELMRCGHFKVAEAYILYRAYRARLREESEQEAPPEQDSMTVVRDEEGNSVFWDGLDLKRRIDFACIGLDLCLDKDEIEKELRRAVYAEITREDLKKTILLNAKSLIERDADFAKFAGRILLTYLYEEVLDWDISRDGIEGLKRAHQDGLKRAITRGIEIERLDPRLKEYDLNRLADMIDPLADLDFDYLGIQTLYDRYLIVDKTRKAARRLETPQIFWMRVSMGLFLNEQADKEGWVGRLYSLYKSRRFCSSTPTLFNAGTTHPQLSSCYLYKVDDNIESIMMRGIAENAFLSKWAGGLGGSWTRVRGTGSYIKGTNGESQGVIPFLKLHNDQLVAVNQGGKRRGSGCAYLETWHNDMMDFLELRRNTGDDRRRTHDMNTANWIPDLFMKRVEARGLWTLFRSSEVPDLHELYGQAFEKRYEEYEALAREGKITGKEVPAIELWKQMLRMLFETGHPWITFKDPCNVRSPQDHTGVIHSSNLCTEITLNTSEEETAVCNLGSVVLDTHISLDGEINHEKLRETIQVAVRALDNVIDLNFYPTTPAYRANSRHRPVGLGVMGLQNALYKKDVSFASEDAVAFNDEITEAVAFYAYEASSDLAEERGAYSTYKGSKWDRGLLPQDTLDLLEKERGLAVDVPRTSTMDWRPLREKIARQGMRNSNVMAIAPTATISNIMGTSPCIEPTYKNLFVKSNLSGDFIVLNQYLVRDLKERGLWTQETLDNLKYFDGELDDVPGMPEDLRQKYLTAFKVDYSYFIDAAARRQKWIDQAQSVNLFLGKPDLKTLSHMYRAAWHKGLKTTYYLRTLGASNIEKATVSKKKDLRGVPGSGEAVAVADEPPAEKKNQSDPRQIVCSLNPGDEECEVCQ